MKPNGLFNIDINKIDVLIHPQSIVHSMVEFIDGSVIAQMGIPDMRIPIAYALTYPERINNNLASFGSCENKKSGIPETGYEKIPLSRSCL